MTPKKLTGMALWLAACIPQAAAPAKPCAMPAPEIALELRGGSQDSPGFRDGAGAENPAPPLASRPPLFVSNEIE